MNLLPRTRTGSPDGPGIGRLLVTVFLMVGVAAGCSKDSGDESDVVTWEGREYVVMWSCPVVDPSLLGESSHATLDPALYGADDVRVSMRHIRGLDPAEVIAIQGPKTVLCHDTNSAGFAVAYSSQTGGDEVERRLGELQAK